MKYRRSRTSLQLLNANNGVRIRKYRTFYNIYPVILYTIYCFLFVFWPGTCGGSSSKGPFSTILLSIAVVRDRLECILIVSCADARKLVWFVRLFKGNT